MPGKEKEISKPLTEWTDYELAAVILSQLWRWMDAGGKSEGRSYDAEMLERARDLLDLPIPPGGEVENRPSDADIIDEARRRRLIAFRKRQSAEQGT